MEASPNKSTQFLKQALKMLNQGSLNSLKQQYRKLHPSQQEQLYTHTLSSLEQLKIQRKVHIDNISILLIKYQMLYQGQQIKTPIKFNMPSTTLQLSEIPQICEKLINKAAKSCQLHSDLINRTQGILTECKQIIKEMASKNYDVNKQKYNFISLQQALWTDIVKVLKKLKRFSQNEQLAANSTTLVEQRRNSKKQQTELRPKPKTEMPLNIHTELKDDENTTILNQLIQKLNQHRKTTGMERLGKGNLVQQLLKSISRNEEKKELQKTKYQTLFGKYNELLQKQKQEQIQVTNSKLNISSEEAQVQAEKYKGSVKQNTSQQSTRLLDQSTIKNLNKSLNKTTIQHQNQKLTRQPKATRKLITVTTVQNSIKLTHIQPRRLQSEPEQHTIFKLTVKQASEQPDGSLSKRQKQFLLKTLKEVHGLQPQQTEHLYSFKKDSTRQKLVNSKRGVKVHKQIDNRSNILMLVRLSTDNLIGVYMNIPIRQTGFKSQNIPIQKVKSCLLNISNKKVFRLKQQTSKKPIKPYLYERNYIIFGNSDLRINIDFERIQSYFGMNLSAFDDEGEGKQSLVTPQELATEFISCDVFQVKFYGEELVNGPLEGGMEEHTQMDDMFKKKVQLQATSDKISTENTIENQNFPDKTSIKLDKSSVNVLLDDLAQNQRDKIIDQVRDYLKYKQKERMSHRSLLSLLIFGQTHQIPKPKIIQKPSNRYYNLQCKRIVNLQYIPQEPQQIQTGVSIQKPQSLLGSPQITNITTQTSAITPPRTSFIDHIQQQQQNISQAESLAQQLQKMKNLNKHLSQRTLNLSSQLEKNKQTIQNIQQSLIKNFDQRKYDIHFGSSTLFLSNSHIQQKKYIVDLLQRQYRSAMRYARLVYRYDPFNKVNIHEYIDNVSQLLVIVKTVRGQIIGGYTHEGFVPDSVGYKGFIFSATKQMDFQPNPRSKKIVTIYDEYYLIFGNSQLRIKTQDKNVFSNFGIVNNYFLTNEKQVQFLLEEGEGKREALIDTYEIYQVAFCQ